MCIGADVRREADELQAAKDHILHQLDSINESNKSSSSATADQPCNINLKAMSMTSKFATSFWLRSYVAKMVSIPKRNPQVSRVDAGAGSIVTTAKFYTLIDIFEKLGDFPVLADVLGVLLSTENISLLTSISNTLQRHSETFHSISAFKKLSRLLLERFHLISRSEQQLPERCLVSSLIKLESHRSLRDARTVTELTSLLSRCDQRLMNIVCSPASDNMSSDNMQSEFEDQIDRVLCSGTSMDEPLMARVFSRIMDEFERQIGIKQSCLTAYSRWLPMLKSFNETGFDRKMRGWISRIIKMREYAVLEEAVIFLVGLGCMSINVLVAAASHNLGRKESNNAIGGPNTDLGGNDAKAASEAIMQCVIILFSDYQRVQGDDVEVKCLFVVISQVSLVNLLINFSITALSHWIAINTFQVIGLCCYDLLDMLSSSHLMTNIGTFSHS